jgi:hypothetical protein
MVNRRDNDGMVRGFVGNTTIVLSQVRWDGTSRRESSYCVVAKVKAQVNVDVDPSKSSELRAAIPALRAKQALLLSVNFGCSTLPTRNCRPAP